jgi:hypothetical protein
LQSKAANGQWKTLSSSQSSNELVGTALGNKIFLAGGNGTNVVDIYDINTNQWTSSNLSKARTSLSATSLNNRVYFAGGDDGISFYDRVDIYNTSNNSWSTSKLSQPRRHITSIAAGTKVFFAGGYTGTTYAATVEDLVDIYDTSTNAWTVERLSVPRENIVAASVGNKVFFAGGSIVDIYDLTTGKWSVAELSIPRDKMAATSNGTKVFFAGGSSDDGTVDVYDNSTNTWTVLNLETPRNGLAVASVGSKVLFCGGDLGQKDTDRVDIYDVNSNTWSLSSLSIPRAYLASAVLGNQAFFFGGFKYIGNGLYGTDVIDVYDIRGPTITEINPITAITGQVVTITGTNFTGTTEVAFGGVKATSFTVVSSTSITAVYNAGSGNISVATPYGTAKNKEFFSPPKIASVSPIRNKPGATVTLSGSNFGLNPSDNVVYFGGAKAAVNSSSLTTLDITVPPGAAYQPISLLSAGRIAFSPTPAVTSFNGLSTISSGSFANKLEINTGAYPTSVKLADLDGDGLTELIVANEGENTISVFRNPAEDQPPSFSYRVDQPVGFQPKDVSIADLDNDGYLDIVTANFAEGLTILRNTSTDVGSISFGDAFTIPVTIDPSNNAGPYTVAVGDLDSDGLLDLVVSHFATAKALIFRNTSSAAGVLSFEKVSEYSVGSSLLTEQPLAITDLDGDGKPDIVAVNSAEATLYVFRNASDKVGAIDFKASLKYAIDGSPVDLLVGDINNDSKMDIIVTSYGANGIVIFPNNSSAGSISFQPQTKIVTTGKNSFRTAIGDLDGDGKLDLVYADISGNSIAILKNLSTTSGIAFANEVILRISEPRSISIGDVTSDGKPDVFVANADRSVVTLFENLVPFNTDKVMIDSFSPTKAKAGDVVTISGSNLSSVTNVYFGGTKASSFSIVSSTTITAVVASGSSGEIILTSPDGDAKTGGFIFYSTPQISSFTPTSGTTGSSITITGTNFSAISSVAFGGVQAITFTEDSPTQITAVVGEGSSGFVNVSNPAGTGTSSTAFVFLPPSATITSFSPSSASQGTTVTITGSNFTNGVTSVSFGGNPATSFVVVSSSTITAVVGGGATGSVTITGGFGTVTKAGFTFLGPPTITSFTPTSAASGTTVTITGTNFSNANSVSFGGIQASTFSVESSTSIKAIVGNGATGNVAVTTSGGNATKSGFTFLPPPTITQFTPSSAAQGVTVTITGTNFSNVTAVSFGGIQASTFSVESSTSIKAIVGNGATGNVSVATQGGTATRSGFTFTNIPATITSFTPLAAGGGTTVTITGSSFTGATAVSFGGIPASSFTVLTPTSISAVVGSGASGSISVTTPSGTTTISGFTFLPAPTITSFSPLVAFLGETVTITGTNFTNATGVSFGGTPGSSIKVTGSSSISVVVGNGSTGNVTVTTLGGTATRSGFTYSPSAPVVSSFMPLFGGTGVTVTINGQYFNGATAVAFGGVPVSSFTVLSSTAISAVLGSGATGSISVTTPYGTSSSASSFSYLQPPTITSFTPVFGTIGTKVTIIGTNFFSGVSAITFGGIPAASYLVNSSTSITATVANGNSGNVAVNSSGGNVSKSGFTYVAPPTITSFSPTNGQPGTSVTIQGANFSANLTDNVVKFNGINATVISPSSSTSLLVTVPAGATTGRISVEVSTVALATSSSTFCINPSVGVAASSNSICLGSFAVLTATGASSYSWTPSVGISWQTGSVVTVMPTVDTNYSVRGTDNFGCSSSVTVPITILNGCNVPGLSSGGTVDAYRMFSIPMKLSDPRVETVLFPVLQKYGGYNQGKMRLVRYSNGSNIEYLEGFNTFEQGKSYWLLSVDPIDINVTGSTQTSSSSSFTLNLSQGWNQIGNPFGFDVSWSDVLSKNSNNANVGNLFVYDPTTISFKQSDNLKTWGGGFVNASVATSIQIPVTVKQATGGRSSNENVFAAGSTSWFIPFQLKHGGSINELGGIGMHPEGNLDRDKFDESTLPRFVNYLEFNSYHNDYFQPRFMKDIVPSQPSFNWEMVAESNFNSNEATLTWDCSTLTNTNSALLLVDREKGTLVDMRKQSEYTFELKNQRQLTVMFAESETLLSSPYTIIGSPFPNPSADKVTLPLMLGGNDEEVLIAIYDLGGKKIKEFLFTESAKGYQEILWDGNSSHGERVTPGMYIIRHVGNNAKTGSAKIILK